MKESHYQALLIRRLKQEFPGCVILKNDSGYLQGFPDLVVLYMDKWAVLEVKASLDARTQPNQEYYVNLLNQMSFAAFICPENEEEVLREIQRAFKIRGSARVPKP